MRTIHCAGTIFTDKNKIMLEDRRKIKKHGEHWSFFGGVIEQGETPQQAMKREIKEELNLNIKKYKFFKKYEFKPTNDLKLIYFMYTSSIPEKTKIKVHKKASFKIFTHKQSLKLKITEQDKKIIRDVIRIKT